MLGILALAWIRGSGPCLPPQGKWKATSRNDPKDTNVEKISNEMPETELIARNVPRLGPDRMALS
jgi:hypothetical protein